MYHLEQMDLLIGDQSLVFLLLYNFIGYDQTSIVIMVRMSKKADLGFSGTVKNKVLAT